MNITDHHVVFGPWCVCVRRCSERFWNPPPALVYTVVVDCHAAGGRPHISKEIAGDLRPSYIPRTRANRHRQSHTLYMGALENHSALAAPHPHV